MATVNVTNRAAQSACPGQSVRVVLNGTDSANLDYFLEGQLVTINSSSKTGYISEVDYFGVSFLVTPKYPFSNLNSSSNAQGLAVGETVVVTI